MIKFAKNTGDDDNWFQKNRVMESSPWNTTELRSNTTLFEMNLSSQGMYFLISEGYKYNTGDLGRAGAHAHWLVFKTSHFCDLRNDTELPVILYSKERTPNYLATQGMPSSILLAEVGFVFPGTFGSNRASFYVFLRSFPAQDNKYRIVMSVNN